MDLPASGLVPSTLARVNYFISEVLIVDVAAGKHYRIGSFRPAAPDAGL